MHRLVNVVQGYDWGSRTAIASLEGRAPSAGPEAELWMGAHPAAPSRLEGLDTTLLALTQESPEDVLGARVRGAFGGAFPFLLKVLAAERPLSLQAHPSKAQAEAGFAEEEARGVPRNAPHRNYKDANHKPELLCALTPFDALCGFREAAESARLFSSLDVPRLAPLAGMLTGPNGIRSTFEALMRMTGAEKDALLAEVIPACARLAAAPGPFADAARWSVTLSAMYPGDVGAVSALLLRHLTLAPGEAIYLPAGNMHAYLRGTGVEIMASSDNVLRGGLTPKHVDLTELLRVLDFEARETRPIVARAVGAHEAVYDTPSPDFRLSRVTLSAGDVFTSTPLGPEILLVTEGAAHVASGATRVELGSGKSVFVACADGPYEIRAATPRAAVIYRATVGAFTS